MGIEWVQVRGYEGFYEISEYGEIRRLLDRNRYEKGTLLKQQKCKKGYYRVGITGKDGIRKSKAVHRLVLSSFGEMKDDLQVNHIDGVKTNNHISNLEWVTNDENVAHKVANGLQSKGEDHPKSKLTKEDVIFIRDNYKPYCGKFGGKPLGIKYGVSHKTIGIVAKGDTWKHI